MHEERFRLKHWHFKDADLVISLGGDGTFLRASHYILDKTPVFGVNLDPRNKEGFFTVSNALDFEQKLVKIMMGKCKIRQLQRVQAFIDGKKIHEAALNEYYIASKIPYHTARYFLTVRKKKERQKSSGILVAAPAGTYAWAKSAGGKELPLFSDQFEYVTREPYCGKISAKCSMMQGILEKNEKITIEFEFGQGIIIADSTAREHQFNAGQKITVTISKNPLYTIRFD